MLLMATRPPATCFILPAVDSISSAFQGPTDTAASQLVVVISAQLSLGGSDTMGSNAPAALQNYHPGQLHTEQPPNKK